MTQVSSHKIGLIAIIALGLVFAWYSGNFVADENYTPIYAALGFLLVLVLAFGFGNYLPLLIPAGWGLNGQISALPLPFDVRELIIILASILYIFDLIFKRNYKRVKNQTADFLVWINIAYIITVFFRNPVGINALGGDRVGGKPYVDVAIGLASYLVLRKNIMPAAFAYRLPIIWVGVAFFNTLAILTTVYLPSVAYSLAPFYSNFNPDGQGTNNDVVVGETRLTSLSEFGMALTTYVVCKYNPVNLFNPQFLRPLIAYLFGLILILLSGFRTGIMNLFVYTSISAVLRERTSGLIKISFIAICLLAVGLLASYSPIKMPLTFQRALSFIPGDWDESAVNDAKGSTDWRVEMWKIVLTSDKYIQNKVLGDGFGFSRADLQTMEDLRMGRGGSFSGSGLDSQQEAFMINGDYHSGPVSSIRFVGVIGFLLFLPLLIINGIDSYKLINYSLKTPYQLICFMLGIGNIYAPIGFIFIFGDYRSGLIGCLFSTGFITMLKESIRDYRKLGN